MKRMWCIAYGHRKDVGMMELFLGGPSKVHGGYAHFQGPTQEWTPAGPLVSAGKRHFVATGPLVESRRPAVRRVWCVCECSCCFDAEL